MASYLSSPRQFQPYTPQVNAELYGNLLAKKDLQYQQGVQKIENTLTQVASLPVARPQDRDYLQQLVTGITSELNQNMGVDWSDQHLNNLTTRHISAISNDPKVQTAVSGALQYKQDYQKQKGDYDEHGEASIANHYHFQKQVNNWMSNPEAGTPYSAQYIGYTDVGKWGDDHISKLKPHWQKIDNPAQDYKDPVTGKTIPAYRQWSISRHMWEEVPKQEIIDVLEAGIRNTPEIATQLAINAEYSFKDYDPRQYAYEKAKMNARQVQSNIEGSKEFQDIALGIKPIPQDVQQQMEQGQGLNNEMIRKMYMTKAKELEEKNAQILSHDYMEDVKDFMDPVKGQEIKNRLYKESWIQDYVTRFGGIRKESHELVGDPFEKGMQRERMEWDIKKFLDEKRDRDLNRALTKEERARVQKRWEFEHGITGTTNLIPQTTPSGELQSPHIAVMDAQKETADNLITQGNNFLYQVLPQDRADELFTKQSNGTIIIKLGKEAEINKLLQDYSNVRKEGKTTYAMVGGQKIPLTKPQITAINNLNLTKSMLKHYDTYKEESDKLVKTAGLTTTDDLIKNASKVVDIFNRAYGTRLSTNDLSNFLMATGSSTILSDIKDLYRSGTVSGGSTGMVAGGTGYEQALKQQELETRYGKDAFNKYLRIYQIPEVRKAVDPSQEDLQKEAKIRNDYAISRGLVPVVYEKPLTDGTKPVDDPMKTRWLGIISNIPGGTESYKVAGRVLDKGDDKATGIIHTFWKGGKAYVKFADTKSKGVAEVIPIPDALIPADLMPPNTESDYKNPVTMDLMDPRKHSNYTNGHPNWEESYPISRDEKGKELRVGFTYMNGQYYKHEYIGHNVLDAKPTDDGKEYGSDAASIGKAVIDMMKRNNMIPVTR